MTIMDPDVRKLLKTRPWEGILLTAGIGVLLLHSLLNQSIRFGNSRYRQPVTMYWTEQPLDFAIVMAVLLVIFMASLIYTIARFRMRGSLMREDQAHDQSPK